LMQSSRPLAAGSGGEFLDRAHGTHLPSPWLAFSLRHHTYMQSNR
jgi:hypothetical protein